MYNNLYNVTPIFYLICVMNIFFDSVINFIICVIPIAPHVSPRELWIMKSIMVSAMMVCMGHQSIAFRSIYRDTKSLSGCAQLH